MTESFSFPRNVNRTFDYSTPFVEGTPTVRGSFSTAWRKARAVALKMPSMTWCVLRP